MTVDRDINLSILAATGFRCAPHLPVHDGPVLRPPEQIAARLMAMAALFAYVTAPEDAFSTTLLREYGLRNQFDRYATARERIIWETPRVVAEQEHRDAIGWRLENMLPLGWALAFGEAPKIDGVMLSPAFARTVVADWLGWFDLPLAALLRRARPKTVSEVAATEDLFYCTHNAVRSAQLGHDTVPAGFHPVRNGGVIHERRHALTWMISAPQGTPGEDWENTDLST